jgi:hypothetical protein
MSAFMNMTFRLVYSGYYFVDKTSHEDRCISVWEMMKWKTVTQHGGWITSSTAISSVKLTEN